MNALIWLGRKAGRPVPIHFCRAAVFLCRREFSRSVASFLLRRLGQAQKTEKSRGPRNQHIPAARGIADVERRAP